MSKPIQVLIFGDLTHEFDQGLRQLARKKDNPLLVTFFEQVAFALRAQLGGLPIHSRGREGVVTFTSFLELLAKIRESPSSHPALEKALVCTHQFARFISHYSEFGRDYPSASQTWLVGLCTGLLTAISVSCCQSLTDLVPLAVHTVQIAFRVGLCVSEMRDRIVSSPYKSLSSWSILVPHLTEDIAASLLITYGEKRGLSAMSKPYISAYADTGLTISGPPDTLRDLIKSENFPKGPLVPLGIRSPFHAPHLYDISDIDEIMTSTLESDFAQVQGKIPVSFSHDGEISQGAPFRALLRSALVDILQEALRFDTLSERLGLYFKHHEVTGCQILPIATLAVQTFTTAFKKAGVVNVILDNSMNTLTASASADTFCNGHLENAKLAIVGYSGRFPDADSAEEFWNLLQEGRDVASETPMTRWDVKTHVDPTGKTKNTSGTPWGCWLKEPGLFDARFFGMSPREAPQVDPAQRLALLTTHEALENAGIVPDATPSTQRDRVGVFFGTTSNDWGETNSSQDIDTYYIPGSCRAFIPGRQNYFFGFSGPSYSVDTACSSSLAAMHLACNALWRGDIDMAISGGTNVMTNPDITAGLDRGHFLSRTGNCKTFDNDADGYCRSEGVCTVIIKRLEDAVADKDPVLGIILSAYTNHSAEAESITRPHVGAQKAIFQRLLTYADVDANDVDYIEMHGTGTQAGDAREMESVLATFANPTAKNIRSDKQPLYLGSAKANVGHGESVSGIVALIKVLLMMEKNEIPRHIGIKTKINTGFPTDLKDRNVHIALENTPWLRSRMRKRLAFINNFSAAGGNSSLLVQEGPDREQIMKDPRTAHMVAITAKSNTALVSNMKSLMTFVNEQHPDLPSLSYTTTARRVHHQYRVMVTGTALPEIITQLEKSITAAESHSSSKPSVPSIAFAFTGQGSQYLGMARELLCFGGFRKDMERYNAISQKHGFPAIMPVLTQTSGDISDFGPTVVQLVTTCIQIAMARLWESWGIHPTVVIGHSLGEYAALNVAGVLSDSDTIFLTGKRAQLLEKKCTQGTHSMLAVRASMAELVRALDGMEYEIACKNSSSETVLSGTNEKIDTISDALTSAGIKTTSLRVPFAFHSSQVDAILSEFQTVAGAAVFNAPSIPVICPVLGTVETTSGTFGPQYLARHCREAVDFAAAISVAKKDRLLENTTWVEIGPHPVLTGLLKSNLESVTVLPSLQRNKDTWKVLTSSLTALYSAGVEIRWAEYHRDFTASLEVLLLPSYGWDLKNYWMQYVNDWSLYKGDAGFLQKQRGPGLSTTSVQRLIDETDQGKMTTVIVESDLLREDLDPMIRGHRVNGIALCTPSVYADIAFTVGDYLRKKDFKWKHHLVDVQHMDVQKPLVAKPKGEGPHLLRARVLMNTEGGKGAVEFYSVTPEGKKLTKHAECTITYFLAEEALLDVRNKAPEILQRMVDLRKELQFEGRVQKLHKSASYVLVSSLASYSDEFKGVEECILDSANLEATSKIRFDKPSTKGSFTVNPYLIDNFGQPGLFVMNANDKADLSKEVFVNHGWTSLQFYRSVSMSNVYRSYIKMGGPDKEGTYTGDMYVFEKDDIVAVIKGIKAQAVPRRLMDYIVSSRDERNATQKSSTDQGPSPPTPQVNGGSKTNPGKPTTASLWDEALEIISQESGVEIGELTDDVEFCELGIDSLLGLLCASRFREELNLDYESSIFMDYPTLKDLKAFWFGAGAATNRTAVISGNDAILKSMFYDDSDINSEEPKAPSSSSSESFDVINERLKVEANSFLLQGNPSSAATLKTLFLLPDGSGSSSSYASLPRLHQSIAVVGMNCPFMKTPEQYNCDIDEVTALYISEIRRRQPHGPYALGGWSVGGIFAYRCAQQLSTAGEVITDLVLIDCPVPKGLDHLPKRYFEYCDQIGLLGVVNGVKKEPPPWLISHFEACVHSLSPYHATPLKPAHAAPDTHIFWACDAIDRNASQKFDKRPDDPEGLKFLTEARKDFGPCGWQDLLPERRILINRIPDSNHFSMMSGEHAKRLGLLIADALLGTM